ncbi:MAG: hypothetical protein ACTHMJ_19275, partial [Thermomicrobiales bacterium]
MVDLETFPVSFSSLYRPVQAVSTQRRAPRSASDFRTFSPEPATMYDRAAPHVAAEGERLMTHEQHPAAA